MRIVGNVNKNNGEKVCEFMSVEGEIRVWDIVERKFKGKGVEEKVYIEYEKVKGDRWDRGNMGVEFNGNKVRDEEMVWLKENIME